MRRSDYVLSFLGALLLAIFLWVLTAPTVAAAGPYGEGTASMWDGPGVARHDCRWPWDDCQPIKITSRQTGLSVVVVPVMYCDCYTGTRRERIVDLDPAAVSALGLNPARGLWPVTVQPVELPDTSVNKGY